MELITDLNIMEGLGTCRDKLEAKAYLMANNVKVSDQELEALQAHCYTETDCKSTLTANQLSTVAGGTKPGAAHGGMRSDDEYKRNLARFNKSILPRHTEDRLSPVDKLLRLKALQEGKKLGDIAPAGSDSKRFYIDQEVKLMAVAKVREGDELFSWMVDYTNSIRKLQGKDPLSPSQYIDLYNSSRSGANSPESLSTSSSESGSPPLF